MKVSKIVLLIIFILFIQLIYDLATPIMRKLNKFILFIKYLFNKMHHIAILNSINIRNILINKAFKIIYIIYCNIFIYSLMNSFFWSDEISV